MAELRRLRAQALTPDASRAIETSRHDDYARAVRRTGLWAYAWSMWVDRRRYTPEQWDLLRVIVRGTTREGWR